MRAGFLIGLNEFEIREMDVPQCHQNEVIVKVEASGNLWIRYPQNE